MIDFLNSEIAQILPEYLRASPETQAISYAIKRVMQKYMAYTKRIEMYAMIDETPEDILDYIAVELDTQYYTQDLPLEHKRELVKGTLAWYAKAGTKAAVEELLRAAFGSGEVIEWFDFESGKYDFEYGPSDPYLFDIVINAPTTEASTEYFLAIIDKVKNARSHIRQIIRQREANGDWYVAAGTDEVHKWDGYSHIEADYEADLKEHPAAGADAIPYNRVINANIEADYDATVKEDAKAGADSIPKFYILPEQLDEKYDATIQEKAKSGADAIPYNRVINRSFDDEYTATLPEKAKTGADSIQKFYILPKAFEADYTATIKEIAKAVPDMIPEHRIPNRNIETTGEATAKEHLAAGAAPIAVYKIPSSGFESAYTARIKKNTKAGANAIPYHVVPNRPVNTHRSIRIDFRPGTGLAFQARSFIMSGGLDIKREIIAATRSHMGTAPTSATQAIMNAPFKTAAVTLGLKSSGTFAANYKEQAVTL